MMFTQTEDLNVLDNDHFVMIFVEDGVSDDLYYLKSMGSCINSKIEEKVQESINASSRLRSDPVHLLRLAFSRVFQFSWPTHHSASPHTLLSSKAKPLRISLESLSIQLSPDLLLDILESS